MMSSLNVSLNVCEYWWEKYKSFSLPLCIYIIENSSMKNRNEYFQCLIESWKLNLLSFKDENVKKRVHEQIQLILSELYSMIVRNFRQRRISMGFSKNIPSTNHLTRYFSKGRNLIPSSLSVFPVHPCQTCQKGDPRNGGNPCSSRRENLNVSEVNPFIRLPMKEGWGEGATRGCRLETEEGG